MSSAGHIFGRWVGVFLCVSGNKEPFCFLMVVMGHMAHNFRCPACYLGHNNNDANLAMKMDDELNNEHDKDWTSL